MPPKRRLLFEEHALDSSDNESSGGEDCDDNGSSLADFIVNTSDEDDPNEGRSDTDSVTSESETEVAQQKAKRPRVVVTPNTNDCSSNATCAQNPVRRGRPSKGNEEKSNSTAEKPPGHPFYPINDFSLTISKLKSDIPVGLIDVVYQFIESYCLKGGVATEVGHRAHNLHLQSTFRINYPKDPSSVKKLTKLVKDSIKDFTRTLKDYRVFLKPLGKMQTLAMMIGYISKDEGQSHFQQRLFCITNEEINSGKREHIALATTYDEDRKVITMKNFFSECFKFIKRSFSPFVVPIDYALLYMLQSKQYVLTPDFISCYRKICFNEANTLWQMLHEPENSTIEQVRAIVFDPRTYDNYRAKQRYFVPGMADLAMDNDDDGHENTVTFTIDNNNNSSSNTPSSDLCLASRLVHGIRRCHQETTKDRQFPTDDEEFIPLPSTPAARICNSTNFECPSTIEEMMKISRSARANSSRTHALLATLRSDLTDTEVVSPSPTTATQPLPSAVRRPASYDMFCDDSVSPPTSVSPARRPASYDMFCDDSE